MLPIMNLCSKVKPLIDISWKQHWLFQANRLEKGYPKPLEDLGLPPDLERIDAAFVWGHNGKTYFFSGKEYWKFDEIEGRVELDYPRKTNAWRGVPQGVDAAFQWMDGNTYFFKEQSYWRFIDAKMRIENKGPFNIGEFWFKCPEKQMEITEPMTTQKAIIMGTDTINFAITIQPTYLYLLIAFVCLCIKM